MYVSSLEVDSFITLISELSVIFPAESGLKVLAESSGRERVAIRAPPIAKNADTIPTNNNTSLFTQTR